MQENKNTVTNDIISGSFFLTILTAGDVKTPEKYADYFKEKKKWLHEWEKDFPRLPNLIKESIFE